jgi:hypothetical protein
MGEILSGCLQALTDAFEEQQQAPSQLTNLEAPSPQLADALQSHGILAWVSP